MKTTERSLKTRRPSRLLRGIGLLICTSIALQPAYALPAARTGSLLTSSSAGTPLFQTTIGGGRFREGHDFNKGTDEGLKLPPMPAPKPGYCRPAVPDKFTNNLKIPNSLLRAPILNDIGPCDSEKADKCLRMLHMSITNPQQALVGSDESRDQLLEVNGGRLTYQKSDILTIQRVLISWTNFTKAGSINFNSNATRLQTADEILLQKILNRMSVEPNKGEPTMQEEADIARIHLNLSEQLAVAAEAALDPRFVDFRNAGALLASINPSASAAFSCLVGFKKSSTEVPYGKKRVILGYFSGNIYAELDDSARQNAVVAAVVGALIGGAFLLAGKIIDTINENRKMEHAEKIQKEKLAHETSEKAKDRALEREKAGLPPENTNSNPTKTSPDTNTAAGNKRPGANPGSQHTAPGSGKPKEDDMFKPFPGSDYDPKDNKHYDTTISCNDGLLEALDRSDPKKHPELVTDYANPDDISGAWNGGDNELDIGLSPEDLYTDYGNPADFDQFKGGIISLDEFRKPSTNLSKECLLIKTTEGRSRQGNTPDYTNTFKRYGT